VDRLPSPGLLEAFGAGDDFVLEGAANGGEVGAVAGDADQQVAVLGGVVLRGVEGGGIDDIELQLAAAEGDVGANEGLHLLPVARGRQVLPAQAQGGDAAGGQ